MRPSHKKKEYPYTAVLDIEPARGFYVSACVHLTILTYWIPEFNISDDEGLPRAARMTECLINSKYMVFSQAIQMDGKYCVSWQVGPSINIMLLVLVAASSARLSPIITSTLLPNLLISSWGQLTTSSSSACGEKVEDKRFSLGTVALLYLWNPASFLEAQSIFPSHHHLHCVPPARPCSWPVSEAAAGAPPLGSLLRKEPRCVDETRPKHVPASRCELHERLPFSPDTHSKDYLHSTSPPPLKFTISIYPYPLSISFFPLCKRSLAFTYKHTYMHISIHTHTHTHLCILFTHHMYLLYICECVCEWWMKRIFKAIWVMWWCIAKCSLLNIYIPM